MIRLKILTLKYSSLLESFDTALFDDFIKDKELIEVREHFFSARGNPHLTLLIIYDQMPAGVKPSTGGGRTSRQFGRRWHLCRAYGVRWRVQRDTALDARGMNLSSPEKV